MSRIANLIQDKIEEMRIMNGKPKWIGLCPVIHKAFSEELNQKRRPEDRNNGFVVDFIGLPVVSMGGSLLPKDGVYIHDGNQPNVPHPFEGREDW